jgi:hydrogenase expression/formation protein HypE
VVERLLAAGVRPHCLRDLTRGGLASALQELASARGVELQLEEAAIPVAPAVASACALLGFDPLHLANEGRLVAVVAAAERERAEVVLTAGGGAWIGTVAEGPARLVLSTDFGSTRLLLPSSGELLPRIC